MELNWYESVLGVAAAAVAAGAAVRTWLGDKEPWNRFPLVGYVVVFSVALMLLAHYVMGLVEEGSTIYQLLVKGVTAAVLAVGTVGVATNLTKPLVRTVGKFVVLVLLGASTLACATRADGTRYSPEANVAIRATQLVAALDALTLPAGSSPVERLVQSKTISRDDALQVAGVIKQTMTYAKDLSFVLQAVDSAKDEAERQAGLARAATLIREISRGLASAPISVGTDAGRKAVVDLLAFASNLLLTIGSIFPAPPPVAVVSPAFTLESQVAWGKDDFWEYLSRFSGWLGSFSRDDSMRECLAAGGCNHIGVRG